MILALLKSEWRLKVALTVIINAVFWAGYGTLGRHAIFPIHEVPKLWLDRAIPFQPEPWSWVYLSHFIFTGGVPWLLPTRDLIRRYTVCVAVMALTSFSVFFFWPTHVSRTADIGDGLAMGLIANYDVPLNAFPSLHAAFLVAMGALALRVFAVPRTVIVVCAIWVVAILYSTIATRQHYSLDLLAGGMLGWFAHWVAWRGAK